MHNNILSPNSFAANKHIVLNQQSTMHFTDKRTECPPSQPSPRAPRDSNDAGAGSVTMQHKTNRCCWAGDHAAEHKLKAAGAVADSFTWQANNHCAVASNLKFAHPGPCNINMRLEAQCTCTQPISFAF